MAGRRCFLELPLWVYDDLLFSESLPVYWIGLITGVMFLNPKWHDAVEDTQYQHVV